MQPKKVGGQYQFTINNNYEDYSSGRVLYGFTGATNFPVRLISEIFQRTKYYLTEQGHTGPYTIYDPFCGAAYSLTVLGLLHGCDIKSIYASDINEAALEFAKKNLSLLTKKGLQNRSKELSELFNTYHKRSHQEALESAAKLSALSINNQIKTHIYSHNILQGTKLPFDASKVDIIITDVPYGKLAAWQGAAADINPTQHFLNRIKNTLSPHALVAISINKKQEATYEGYTKIKSFKIGTRKVLFLKTN